MDVVRLQSNCFKSKNLANLEKIVYEYQSRSDIKDFEFEILPPEHSSKMFRLNVHFNWL